MPTDRRGVRCENPSRAGVKAGRPALSRAGSRWFSLDLPDIEHRHPFDVWSRLLARVAGARPRPDLLVSGDPGGYRPLRAAIAAYLRTARAVRCDEDQVIVVSMQQALTLAVNVLMEAGDERH